MSLVVTQGVVAYPYILLNQIMRVQCNSNFILFCLSGKSKAHSCAVCSFRYPAHIYSANRCTGLEGASRGIAVALAEEKSGKRRARQSANMWLT